MYPGAIFNTPTGSISFAEQLDASYIEPVGDGWNFTDAMIFGDDERLDYVWLTVEYGHMTVNHLAYHKMFSFTLASDGSMAEVKAQLSNRTSAPARVDVNGMKVEMATNESAYEGASETTWYWNGTFLFVKIYDASPASVMVYWGYSYWIRGPYYENGTAADVNLTVSVVFRSHIIDQFVMNPSNGTVLKTYTANPIMFIYDLGDAQRVWFTREEGENITIFIPYGDYQYYTFQVKDYRAVIPPDSYLIACSVTNGTFGLTPITRLPISGSATVRMLLQVGRTYLIKIVGSGLDYEIAWFTADPNRISEELIVNPAISSRVKLAYQYVQIDASRTENTVTVAYQDNTRKTEWVDVYIKYWNGTVAYHNKAAANIMQTVWDEAEADMSYVVEVYVEHEEFGPLTYRKALPAIWTGKSSPFNLAFLGSSPIPADQIVGLIMILFLAGMFSVLNAAVGIVIVCLVAGFLAYIGWLNIPFTVLSVVLSLAVIYALSSRGEGEG